MLIVTRITMVLTSISGYNLSMPYKDASKQRTYGREHYSKNKEKYLESNKRRRDELRNFVRLLKQKTPCKDCGISYPHYVMDFDHLKDKEGLISKFIANNNRTGLHKEIAKCEIVCSNCQRERSYQRLRSLVTA